MPETSHCNGLLCGTDHLHSLGLPFAPNENGGVNAGFQGLEELLARFMKMEVDPS